MAKKTTCDCGRAECGGLEVVGPNAGENAVVLRTPTGIRFRVEVLPGPDSQRLDLRTACVSELLRDGEVVEVEGQRSDGAVLRLGS